MYDPTPSNKVQPDPKCREQMNEQLMGPNCSRDYCYQLKPRLTLTTPCKIDWLQEYILVFSIDNKLKTVSITKNDVIFVRHTV